MSSRYLTVARLVEDEIGGIEIEGDAFGDLLDSLGIVPKVEQRAIVMSARHGSDDTRAYIVSVHTVPGADGTTQVYACTCTGFKFHQLYEHREEIHDDPEAGQQGFEAFRRRRTNITSPGSETMTAESKQESDREDQHEQRNQ
jgi:hypothetical protein